MRKVLSVAEKPSVAKELAAILSNNQARSRVLASQYNRVFEFQCTLDNAQCNMAVTSVTGHLMEVRSTRTPPFPAPGRRLRAAAPAAPGSTSSRIGTGIGTPATLRTSLLRRGWCPTSQTTSRT